MKCAVLLILLLVIGRGEGGEGRREGGERRGEEGQVKQGDMEVIKEKRRRRVVEAGKNFWAGEESQGPTGEVPVT